MIVKRERAEDDFLERLFDARMSRLEDKIAAVERLLEQRADAGDKALDVAKTGLNEMRGMALDQQNAFVTRAEYSAKHSALEMMMNAGFKEIASKQVIMSEELIAMRSVAKGVGLSWQTISVVISLGIGVSGAILALLRFHG